MLSPTSAPDGVDTDVIRMLSLARPAAADPIAVIGPNALDLTLQLCRLGYDEVICSCLPGGPACNERSHVVLIGGPVASQQLILLLRHASSMIDEDAVLVLRLADIDQDRVVEATLAARGFAVASTVFNLSGAPIVCHRVRRADEAGVAMRQAA